MAGSHSPFSGLLRDLGSLMVAGAGESVTMVKRSAPEQALKLKKTDEWKLYLEFLKVMFNLADRLSALHVPIREQPQFMDSLEDTVSHQLRTVLEPALSPDSDEMEIVAVRAEGGFQDRPQLVADSVFETIHELRLLPNRHVEGRQPICQIEHDFQKFKVQLPFIRFL